MPGVGSGTSGVAVGERFPQMQPKELVCRCRPSGLHCSPACEACRILGMSRVHPRRDYNRRTA